MAPLRWGQVYEEEEKSKFVGVCFVCYGLKFQAI